MSATVSVPSGFSGRSDNKIIYFDLNVDKYPKLITKTEITSMKDFNIESTRHQMAKILELNSEMETADAIMTDYFFWSYWWAKCNLMYPNKIETYLTIKLFILSNMRDRKLDQQENIKQLKKMLMSSIVLVTDENPMNFTSADFKGMLDHIAVNFFQHYRLYECCYRRHRKEMVVYHTLQFETIESSMEPFPTPLHEAMSEEAFKTQIDPDCPPVFVSSFPEAFPHLTYILQNIHGN